MFSSSSRSMSITIIRDNRVRSTLVRFTGKEVWMRNFGVKEEPFAFHARATVRVRTERGLDRWCRGLGAANFAPFRNSARMKMIWDQRNSTPVIQHFSPKLLGLSYQRQRAIRRVSGGVRARERPSAPAPRASPRRRIQHGVSS